VQHEARGKKAHPGSLPLVLSYRAVYRQSTHILAHLQLDFKLSNMAHTQQHPRHLEPRPRLPVPDLRLETTFLRSISPYVHDGGARVQWAMVAWVAVRDSMLSPMMW
jgi:hypothetical protein